MKLALVGLPGCGKTTLLNALTGVGLPVAAFDQKPNIAEAKVPDERLTHLSSIFSPKKTTPTTVRFTDVPGILPGEANAAERLGFAREADALVHVLRAFDSPTYPHPLVDLDPARDRDTLQAEMALADAAILTRRVEKLTASKKRPRFTDENALELALLERLLPVLEEELTLMGVALTPEEKKVLGGYAPLTLKPQLLLINRGDSYDGRPFGDVDAVEGAPLVDFDAKLECDLLELEGDERTEFMADLGVEELGGGQVVRRSHDLLGLQCFLTVGEDECRAWTIPVGASAVEAAGAIHSDLARGFIRAEVVGYDDFVAVGNSIAKARDAGKLRLEGKEYVVADGDILNILHNV